MELRAKKYASWNSWQGIRERFFATPSETFVTILIFALLMFFFPAFWQWAVSEAQWTGDVNKGCQTDGACWLFVRDKLRQFTYGFYPREEQWRVNLVFLLFFAGVTPLLKLTPFRGKKALGLSMLLIFPVLAFWLLRGGAGLKVVPTSQWGGLMLTLVIAVVGIAASLPLGTLLALGRRSGMPVIQRLSVLFIELWRGVPLITVLFMASVMLPLFMPKGMDLDKLLRVLVGVSLFSSAYMAEVIRGGLQAIPRGQMEAAQALGLGYWQAMWWVILPQALKKVIPGIVNTFIGLFKDTTLVLIVGMFDLLGIVQAAATDPKWLGNAVEGYFFAGLVYWVFCYGMSRYSQLLEKRLETERV